MSVPFLSIIIPVYNIEKYIEKCINSIIKQSFKDFECILIDDGSTDRTGVICEKLKSSDIRIKTLHEMNSGVAIARKNGLKAATGEYIMFVDGDDYLENEILTKSVEKLKNTNAEIIVFGYKRVTNDGVILKESIPPENYSLSQLHTNNSDLTFLLWNKIYKRNLFDKINIESIDGVTFSEDSYLTLALQKVAIKTVFLSEIGYSYFLRTDSVTQNMSVKNNEDRIRAVQLMDSLYSDYESKPYVLGKIKYDTKFFLINPSMSYDFKTFFSNCKRWRNIFPESSSFFKSCSESKKLFFYICFISLHFDFLAYILYQLSNFKKKLTRK